MSTAYTDERDVAVAAQGVYAPQDDSRLLIDVLEKTGLARAPDRRSVHRQRCGGDHRVRHLSRCRALCTRQRGVRGRGRGCAPGVVGARGRVRPFDHVVCNPVYVPHDPRVNSALPAAIGPARAWNAGYDGRLVLDPLCQAVPDLLADRGSLLLVQSEFADARRTLAALSSAGLDAEVVAWQWIPFGPVRTSRA